MMWALKRARARQSTPLAGRGMPGLARILLVGFVLGSPTGLRLAWGAAPVPPQDNKGSAAPAAQPKASGLAGAGGDESLISPNDLLFIQVFDVDQLTHEYRVTPAGTLAVPLLRQPVHAAGLTTTQLAQLLTQKFQEAGLLTDPQIAVTIRETRVHGVIISGAVHKPQMVQIQGHTTLLDVLSEAGGPTDEAGETVTVMRGDVALRALSRTDGNGGEGNPSVVPSPVTIDLKRLLEVGDQNTNVEVFPGDRVNVPQAGIVYVVGAVNKSGGYVMTTAREDMTVLKALALAGDVTITAKKTKALIIRKNPALPNGREEIPVNINKVIAGRAPDRTLLANDILFVPDSTGKRALRRSADAVVFVGTGLAIYRP